MNGPLIKHEDEPITDDEWLIRLVWKDRYKPERTPIITTSSFQPRDSEISGISTYRRACLVDFLEALNGIAESKRDGYAIVTIRAALIKEIGWTV